MDRPGRYQPKAVVPPRVRWEQGGAGTRRRQPVEGRAGPSSQTLIARGALSLTGAASQLLSGLQAVSDLNWGMVCPGVRHSLKGIRSCMGKVLLVRRNRWEEVGAEVPRGQPPQPRSLCAGQPGPP